MWNWILLGGVCASAALVTVLWLRPNSLTPATRDEPANPAETADTGTMTPGPEDAQRLSPTADERGGNQGSGVLPGAADVRSNRLTPATRSEQAIPTETADTGTMTPAPEVDQDRPPTVDKRWGIEVTGVRLGAAGNMLDLRYVVVDPAKAGAVLDREDDLTYLIDESSGVHVPLATAARGGSSRRTALQLETGRTYSLNFPNPGKRFQGGSRVTLVMGDFRAEHLPIQ